MTLPNPRAVLQYYSMSPNFSFPAFQHNRRSFLCGAALLAGISACAAPALANSVAPPLWTVTKGGKTIYVLGESLPRSADWHAAEVEALLPHCGHLWTETNQTYREKAGMLVRKFGMSVSPAPLKLLTPSQMTRLEQAAFSAKLDLKDLAGARPWLVGATLEDAGYQAAGLTGKSANTILSAKAVATGLPVSSEFAVKDDVFAWFGGMSPVEEAQFLCYVVDGVLLGRAGMEQISTSWLSGRAEPAASFVDHERLDYPQLYARLTAERNRDWVPRFEAMLASAKPTMVIVGLYHLVGPDSLLIQMRKAGFEVRKGAR